MDVIAGELTASQIADFDSRRRRIREQYDLGTEQQDYASQIASNQAGQNQADILDNYRHMRDRLPYSYGARGLLNSGIYARDLVDKANEVNRALTENQQNLNGQMAGFQLAKDQLARVQAGGLSDIDEAQAAQIASVAAALRASGY